MVPTLVFAGFLTAAALAMGRTRFLPMVWLAALVGWLISWTHHRLTTIRAGSSRRLLDLLAFAFAVAFIAGLRRRGRPDPDPQPPGRRGMGPGLAARPAMTPTLTGEPLMVQDRDTDRGDAADAETLVVTRLRDSRACLLAAVAVIGAALSYTSLQTAAAGVFHGSVLAYGFPLLVDALILGASLQYVAGVRAHTPGRTGWRATAHAAIAATLLLNTLAAIAPNGGGPAAVPWHITAPAAWAVLVELYARTAAGQWRTDHAETRPGIPLRLWATAPLESTRTWLRQARLTAAVTARYDVGRHAAALEALHLTLPGRYRPPRPRRPAPTTPRGIRNPGQRPGRLRLAPRNHVTGPLHPRAVLRAALAGHPTRPRRLQAHPRRRRSHRSAVPRR